MPSFDIVSEADMAEVDNAIQNVMREISVRYDFKGSNSSVESSDGAIKVFADDDLKLKQLHETLRGNLHKRGIEPRDDLQSAIQFVKDMGLEQPVQFKNFRD